MWHGVLTCVSRDSTTVNVSLITEPKEPNFWLGAGMEGRYFLGINIDFLILKSCETIHTLACGLKSQLANGRIGLHPQWSSARPDGEICSFTSLLASFRQAASPLRAAWGSSEKLASKTLSHFDIQSYKLQFSLTRFLQRLSTSFPLQHIKISEEKTDNRRK